MKNKQSILRLMLCAVMFSLFSCNEKEKVKNTQLSSNITETSDTNISLSNWLTEKEEIEDMELLFKINEGEIKTIDWYENESVRALKQYAKEKIEINMRKYGGFEQVGSLGRTLPSEDERITTSAGDIVLYSSNQLVIFYGSNTWEYTKLGHINLSEEELKTLLGEEDVTITIELKK